MKKLNKKLMGIFLSVFMIAAFSAVASAKIKTVELNVVDEKSNEVSDGAKILALSAAYDKILEKNSLKSQNLVNQNELIPAGELKMFKKDGKMPLYYDFSDKSQLEAIAVNKLEKKIKNGEANKIISGLEDEDIKKSKEKAIKQMQQKLENLKKVVENEDEQKKLNLNKDGVEFQKNDYIPDLEKKIEEVRNIKIEEVQKAKKFVKFKDLKDVTEENEEHDKKIMSKEDYEKMKKAEEEFEKSLIKKNG